jgi:lipoprotein signal peptidase
MVKKIRKTDGRWEYDYSVFDKWVEYMMGLGIDDYISCYSMIPWKLEFDYYDEASGKDTSFVAEAGSKEYKLYWGLFLSDFAAHLRSKGWFEKTIIAMDERPAEAMLAAFETIFTADPDFKVSLAGNWHPEIERSLFDYCLYSGIIALGIFLDQLTKWLAEKFLFPLGKSVTVIPYVAKLTYAENRGAAFGSLEDSRWIFMVASTVLILILSAYLYLGFSENKLYEVSIAMIISGGIGNMIDRLALGYVIDFIDFRLINFAVFNFADCCVVIGTFLLIIICIYSIYKEHKEKSKSEVTANE